MPKWGQILRKLRRRFVSCVTAICIAVPGFVGMAQADENATRAAFVNFLANGDYNNANFYLQNNLVRPGDLNTAQIFYDILHTRYWSRLRSSTTPITTLYGYLSQIDAVDINTNFRCRESGSSRSNARCRLLHDLVTGQPASVIAFFADLGLDLNRTFEDRPPATYDVIDRLGLSYSIADIQLLSQKGMVFGDEAYNPVNLAGYREFNYDRGAAYQRQTISRTAPKMPHNYLSVPQFNFMDALTVALGNPVSRNRPVQASIRDDTLCQYITYVAAQMAPSFDYLQFVLANREEFRAALIGVRKRKGNDPYSPFPPSCVNLMAGMAQNHTRLNDVIQMFGARGDVETARWLLSLKAPQAVQTAPVQQ